MADPMSLRPFSLGLALAACMGCADVESSFAGTVSGGMSGSSGYAGVPASAGHAGAASGQAGSAGGGAAGQGGAAPGGGGATACEGAEPPPEPPPLCWHGACLLTPRGTADRPLRHLWAAGPSDVWATGAHGRIEHWDGQGWSRVESGTSMDLVAVDGTSPGDVWTGGSQGLMHREGSSWTLVDSEPVDALAVRDGRVWVVRYPGVVSVWDGSSWTSLPEIPHLYGQWSFDALRVRGADDVWALSSGCTVGPGTCDPFFGPTWWVQHWDGSS